MYQLAAFWFKFKIKFTCRFERFDDFGVISFGNIKSKIHRQRPITSRQSHQNCSIVASGLLMPASWNARIQFSFFKSQFRAKFFRNQRIAPSWIAWRNQEPRPPWLATTWIYQPRQCFFCSAKCLRRFADRLCKTWASCFPNGLSFLILILTGVATQLCPFLWTKNIQPTKGCRIYLVSVDGFFSTNLFQRDMHLPPMMT